MLCVLSVLRFSPARSTFSSIRPTRSRSPLAMCARCDAFAVDERAVRARKVLDFELLVARRQTAVQSRHERAIDDEVGARRPGRWS